MPRVSRAVRTVFVSLCVLLGLGAAYEVAGQETPVFGPPLEMAFERRLREALRQPVTMRFEEAPLHEVVTEFERQVRIPVALDLRALDDAGLDADTPVTFRCEQLAARHALDLMLSEIELSWCNKQLLVITTKEKADEQLIVRVYPVADLIADGSSGEHNFQELLDTISSTVAPETWDSVGGQGSMRPVSVASAFVMSQTREVHEGVEDLLFAIRATRQAQGLPTLGAVGPLRHETQQSLERLAVSERHALGVPAQPGAAPDVPYVVPAWQRPRRHDEAPARVNRR